MTLAPSPCVPEFPEHPSDGFQIKEDLDNGGYAIWTYNEAFNQWTVEVFNTPLSGYIFTDQVRTRPSKRGEAPELFTQQDVNYYLNDKSSPVDDEYATKQQVQALAMAVVNSVQAMESAQGVKTKGKWAHHGGPLPESGIPAESQFWMADAEGNKTQEYCDAAVIRIHAIGLSDLYRENNVLGAAEVGDLLIIQDLSDLDGCQYEITSVEFHDPVDGNYENAYAVYGVKPDETFCRGNLSPAELVSVRIKTAFSSEGGDYLPLTGGAIAGNLSVSGSLTNQGGIMMAGAKDKALSVYDLQGGAVFSAYGDKFGGGVQYYGAIEAPNHVTTKAYVDEQVAAAGGLSHREKMYLQGFYPFKFGGSTQIDNPGEFLVKDSSYLVTQDPEKWKYFYFSTTDAYGEDLAGKFLNHMHMESQHEGQIWIAKENGYKLCAYIGGMKAKDQNFEQYFNLEMDNTREFLNPPHYDTQALRVDKGEILWIKCSFWGN